MRRRAALGGPAGPGSTGEFRRRPVGRRDIGDADRLQVILRELLDDPARAKQIAEAGYKRAEGEFSWEQRAKRVLQVYRDAGLRRWHPTKTKAQAQPVTTA